MSNLKEYFLIGGGIVGYFVILFTVVDLADKLKSRFWSIIIPFLFPLMILGIFISWLLLVGSGDKTARDIIARMTQNYTTCTSYQDEGVCNSTFIRDNSGTELESRPFKTYFVRPSLFRLEWKKPWYQKKEPVLCVLWSDGSNTSFYQEPDRLEHEISLDRGLRNTTSLAGGPSHLVPVMLCPYINTFLNIYLKSFAVVGEEEIQGVRCYHLSGKYAWLLGSWEMWVGKDDYLLRRLESQMRMKNGYSKKEEIHSKIMLNAEIPRPIFNFQPPSSPKATEAPPNS